jgi:hypothetical protein
MDDLDELLLPKPPPAEPSAVHDAVMADARRVQRRRCWLVRARRVVIAAVCYVGGLATVWSWSGRHESPPPAVVERDTTPDPPAAPTPAVDPYRNDPPERIERWAFIQSGPKRAGLYRRAGDEYLRRDDVDSALRCYRTALDGGSPADLAVRADEDTWLLMSLKVARQKERPDARVN